MPKRRGPYMYQRPGRLGWYAYLDRDHFHISLETQDEAEARVAFGKLLERERHLELAPGEVSIAKLVSLLRVRAETANTEKTAYELHLNLRRLTKWFEDHGIVTMRKIDKQAIEDYKTARRFTVSAGRVNRELDSLARLMRFAIEKKHAHPWALESIVKLREPKPEPDQRTVSRAEFNKFIRRVPPAYRPLFRGAIGSGLRDGELRHIEPKDVRDAEVAVAPKRDWDTKGFAYRHIPISPQTAKALRAWIKARDAGTVNADQKRVWTIMANACNAAKVDRFSLQDLRRAWASHLFATGNVTLKEISLLLGHKEVATTERYLRLTGRIKLSPQKLPW